MASGLVNVFSEEQFSFDGKNVRSFYVNGESLLMAKNVCLAIGYNKTTYRNALENHVPSKYKIRYEDLGLSKRVETTRLEKSLHKETFFLTEPGLYCLLLRSKMDAAEPFMDWVVETVLPREVRKLNEEHQSAIEEDSYQIYNIPNRFKTVWMCNKAIMGDPIRLKSFQTI